MISSSDVQEVCPLCREDIGEKDVAREKGAAGINAESLQREDDIIITDGSKVHSKCCKGHINLCAIKKII